MSLSHELHKRASFHIDHEPTCDRCGHGASLHTLTGAVPCIGCGERAAVDALPRAVCIGFASEWFDNTQRHAPSTGRPARTA